MTRLARLTGLAAGLAGHSALRGGRALIAGQRPNLRDMVLTPDNARRLTEQLSQMRGAAMKVGQLLSMEASDLLPPDLADILSRLRANAHHMPPSQLKAVLVRNWGPDFLSRFSRFDVHPIAAASIGQVHRAVTLDGRELAIKVQYPGVRASIDSDVRNVGVLIRLSGLAPEGLELGPLLDDARTQLHDEADYLREARFLADFGRALADDPAFVVPRVHADLTTDEILAMDYVEGVPLDQTFAMAGEVRDRIARNLVSLLLRELFEFTAMQTDPNFANYLYQPGSGRIVLLDFGAARRFDGDFAEHHRRLLRAGLAGDLPAIRDALLEIGYIGRGLAAGIEARVLDIFGLAMTPLVAEQPFDFGSEGLISRLRAAGIEMAEDRTVLPPPPIDALLLQRKIAGMLLLAERLRARVGVSGLVRPYA